ncbi:MAG: EcsC family protein [Bacteroidia bacterium]|nr:EcsC family protein [Bacteroidia bacterium]
MAKLNSSESKILDEIAKWKASNPSFLNKSTDFVAKPISWLTEKLTPEDVKGSVGGVTEKIVETLQDMSKWSVNPQDILNATKEFEINAATITDLRKASIHDLDHVSESQIESNTRMATASGVGTGLASLAGPIVGWAALLADLPALFTFSTRTIYQVALCYGYDPNSPELSPQEKAFEMEYMMRIFKVATSSDKVQKQKALGELKDFEAGRYSNHFDEILGDFTKKQISKNATSYISRMIIKEIVERTITRKAVGLVPGLGAVFSGGFNYVYIKDVGNAAFMLYRERFLLDKKGRKKTIKIEID